MFSQRVRHRVNSVAAAVLLTGAVLAGTPQAAQAADPWTCPSGGNPAVWNPDLIITPQPARFISGRKIELRYHTSTRCAWGRISNGVAGDQVWVDWSTNGGRDWRQLGVKSIGSGGTQVYTTAFNDYQVKMRACGNAGSPTNLTCTDWY